MSYLELATLPSAPFWARCQTKAALKAWQLWPDTIETAELLVSELVTNAIKMSGPTLEALAQSRLDGVERISLTLRLMPGRLVIEVFDNNQSPPILADAGTDAESGRGLMLVQALSKEWGHFFPPAGGKTVYCVLGLPPLIHTHLTPDASASRVEPEQRLQVLDKQRVTPVSRATPQYWDFNSQARADERTQS